MKLKVCVCCGELMEKPMHPFDRFPNICLKCEALPELLEGLALYVPGQPSKEGKHSAEISRSLSTEAIVDPAQN